MHSTGNRMELEPEPLLEDQIVHDIVANELDAEA
jgi:hypothetical protein